MTLILRARVLHSFKHRRLRACCTAQVDPRVVVKKTLSSIIPWMFFVVIWTYLGAAAHRPAFWPCLFCDSKKTAVFKDSRLAKQQLDH